MTTMTEPSRKVRDHAEALALLAEWERSDEPVSNWCRERGINWRSLVAYKGVPTEEPRFVEVAVEPAAPVSHYRIELLSGVAIEVDDHFRAATLGRLLEVLAPC
jgi:hypothetical protein